MGSACRACIAHATGLNVYMRAFERRIAFAAGADAGASAAGRG